MSPWCDKCGNKEKHIEKHDAYACLHCDEWTEKKCKYELCEFCAARPEKPSEVKK